MPLPFDQPAQDLPAPGADEVAHSARLAARIHHEIETVGGSIPFSRFMELALYAPGLGYYSAGSRKFGAAGDFVTAPEISPLFAQCIARQCAETLTALGGGSILELGAGAGSMALDILEELERLQQLPEKYLILEISAELRARQQQLLQSQAPELAARVHWLDKLPESSFSGVILANEVLDALPVERFRATADGICALHVARQDKNFMLIPQPPDMLLNSALAELSVKLRDDWPLPYESEIRPQMPYWLAAVCATLERGLVLFIDYGLPQHEYYHPSRSAGTLMCHYRHRAHPDPFRLVGLQDITAYVDFSAVANSAEGAGLELLGYTTQAHFLLAAGLEEVMARTPPADETAWLKQARDAKLLTLPDEMGERFKAMALGKNHDRVPSGFTGRDLTHTL